ncbi:conjugative transfer ATPase [Aggregatibacter actinomycetemcomitans]|uniref:conjugative transfer ATPase n=1 Tax=Aggregatibacter actinomycetemcomitans TaxID=714 RepID=UPI00197C35E3|nr:conjugative transfer ATPase [Aggregatibacter actinomycetemcomitans]MBN6058675.1 conjugative transfer ATPase [Aggregatibacter actinomycetemcomitans]MBN6087184.1 conjugative transfer ATPase [Aggregatibacter actinomycetemcomitans]
MSLLQDVIQSFFPPKGKKSVPGTPKIENTASIPHTDDITPQFGAIPRSGKLTRAQHNKALYGTQPSFIDHLPWAEFLDDAGVMLFDDGRSAGAVFDVKPIGTEGRSENYLNRVRTLVKDALQDSFDELDNNPYVVQFYCQDEKDLSSYVEHLRHYIKNTSPEAAESAFTEQWLSVVERHLRDVTKPGGLFIDNRVTNTAWAGKIRKTRMVIYRYTASNETEAISQLNNACERINSALSTAGLVLKRQTGKEIHDWLLRWFNPNPAVNFANIDNKACYDLLSYPAAEKNEMPLDWQDFSENLFYSQPQSQNGYWYFDNQPHEVIVVNSIRKEPLVGHMTGEVTRGRNINALFDLLPESTTMVITLVIHPQDHLQAHLDKLSDRAVGNNYDSIYLKQDAITVMKYLKDGHKLYQGSIAFYVRGQDEKELKNRARELRTILLSNNMVPVKEDSEVAPLNSYLRWLPMNFNPQQDAKSHYYTKYYWVQHIANMLPVFGRETGTGHPGITYFNRGGTPFDFDPLNPKDRTKNAHKLILGPTGSGKSATLTAQMSQLMAVHRPRLFIVEAGNSFGLFADYAERYGLTINRVSLEPSSDIVLPLFSEAHKLLEMDVTVEVNDDDSDEEENSGEEQRDLLAEMELTARLMITGGEIKEDNKMSRADRSAIRQAILLAARKTAQEQRRVLTGDVKAALAELNHDENIRPERQSRLAEMAEAMDMFCTGVNGRFFNREGEIWPEADITLVDLAMFAREGYEAELAIAYISLINHINSLGEKYQHSFRPIVNITDESHIITVNPLLAKFLVKGSKMWRKLGIWLWLATQNMADFPDAADKLLSMIEWWELLNLSNDEVEQVNRFRRLTEAQKLMLLSAKKADRKYTEGVVLATNMEALFRVVPPSLFLALGMTEKHEKAQRKQLMIEHNCIELDAALMVAQELDRKRGIAVNDDSTIITA